MVLVVERVVFEIPILDLLSKIHQSSKFNVVNAAEVVVTE
jgi:hypothetical protein